MDKDTILQQRLNKIEEVLGIKHYPNAPQDELTILRAELDGLTSLSNSLHARLAELEKVRIEQRKINTELVQRVSKLEETPALVERKSLLDKIFNR